MLLIFGMRMAGTNKSLGQHWLNNRAILNEIASLTGSGDLCVEIGPGLGTLTSSLLKCFKKVIAVEYDKRLAENLPKSFPGKNLEVINGDILEFDFGKVSGPYRVAGNIPYYITSPIIEKVLTAEHTPERVVLLMQKEVAERIASDKETVLSLFVKNRADIELGPIVKKDEFTPPPKVNSQVLVLNPHEPRVNEDVFKLIKTSFKATRKKLIHNLAGLKSKDKLKEAFGEARISTDARPGDLHLDDYEALFKLLS